MNKFFFAAPILFTSSVLGQAPSISDFNWAHNPINNHWYGQSHNQFTWQDGDGYASNLGLHLVSIQAGGNSWDTLLRI
jgi:hypothetical protein